MLVCISAASLILLIPVALEHQWLEEGGGQRVRLTIQRFKELVTSLGARYWTVVKARLDRYRARSRQK